MEVANAMNEAGKGFTCFLERKNEPLLDELATVHYKQTCIEGLSFKTFFLTFISFFANHLIIFDLFYALKSMLSIKIDLFAS